MPSYLDLGLIVVVLISALLSMLRGFTREVLAIASWGAAAAAAYFLYPMVLPYVPQSVSNEQVRLGIAAAGVFFVTLIIVSIITVKISDAILDSKVGALDRSLGFVFGAARGLLICVVAFMFFNWLVPEKGQPDWAKEGRAKTRPLLQATSEYLMALLPDDPEGAFQKWRQRKAGGDNKGSDDTPADDAPKSPAPAPAAPPR